MLAVLLSSRTNWPRTPHDVTETPPYGQLGVLAYDPLEDKVQCHICGRWYRGLNNHVLRTHGYTVANYQAEFGLNRKQSLICEGTRQTLRRVNKELGNWKHLYSQTLTKEQLGNFLADVRLPRGWKHRQQGLLSKRDRLLAHNPMNNPLSQAISQAKLRHTWYGTARQVSLSRASLRKAMATLRARNVAKQRYVCCGLVFPIREDMRCHRKECHR